MSICLQENTMPMLNRNLRGQLECVVGRAPACGKCRQGSAGPALRESKAPPSNIVCILAGIK